MRAAACTPKPPQPLLAMGRSRLGWSRMWSNTGAITTWQLAHCHADTRHMGGGGTSITSRACVHVIGGWRSTASTSLATVANAEAVTIPQYCSTTHFIHKSAESVTMLDFLWQPHQGGFSIDTEFVVGPTISEHSIVDQSPLLPPSPIGFCLFSCYLI